MKRGILILGRNSNLQGVLRIKERAKRRTWQCAITAAQKPHVATSTRICVDIIFGGTVS